MEHLQILLLIDYAGYFSTFISLEQIPIVYGM